jgi:hypothetical protein
MLRRLGLGLLFLVLGYPLGLLGGMGLVYLLSDNRHDKSVEAAMTGAFFGGPLAAVIGFLVGLAMGGRSRGSHKGR